MNHSPLSYSRFLLISFLLFVCCNVSAKNTYTHKQTGTPSSAHVYFSNEIPVGGKAPEVNEFAISSAGGFAYLVVNNYPSNFNYDEIQLKVLKSINGVNQTFDTKVYTIGNDVFSTYIKYDFNSTGYYTFEVSSKYGSLLGSATVTIKSSNASSSSSSSSYSSSSNSSSSTRGSDDCIAGSYKKYNNTNYGFSMCIPTDSYGEDGANDKITLQGFFGHKLDISFMNERDLTGGIDKFDASVIDMARDLVKSSFTSYFRKEFKLVTSKDGNTIYRSVISATSNNGTEFEQSIYYIRMGNNKIKSYDVMSVSGPLVKPSSDGLYQIIIELGMLGHLKIY